jgi:hypothetical protein
MFYTVDVFFAFKASALKGTHSVVAIEYHLKSLMVLEHPFHTLLSRSSQVFNQFMHKLVVAISKVDPVPAEDLDTCISRFLGSIKTFSLPSQNEKDSLEGSSSRFSALNSFNGGQDQRDEYRYLVSFLVNGRFSAYGAPRLPHRIPFSQSLKLKMCPSTLNAIEV